MGMMVDALKQAFDRAAQQSEEEQTALAALIMEVLEADDRWEKLFADPLPQAALDALAADALAEDEQGL